MLTSHLFGPVIQNWETHRCISVRTKVVTITGTLVAGGLSLLFAIDHPALRIATAMPMMIGAATLMLMTPCPKIPPGESRPDAVQEGSLSLKAS
ncbi:MAG: DUF454 family protein [Halioglobus sp.]|nr:DUF454 family protein [Halioglobus sp.]